MEIVERPILFSPEMVNALLREEDPKTQTRRIFLPSTFRVRVPKPVPGGGDLPCVLADPGIYRGMFGHDGAVNIILPDDTRLSVKPGEFDLLCPYMSGKTYLGGDGKGHKPWIVMPYPGQRLWVRERMRVVETFGKKRIVKVRYEADGETATVGYPRRLAPPKLGRCLAYGGHREASRILLEPLLGRLEFLHAITEEDAKAEGARPFFETFTSIGRDQRLTSGELAAEAEHRAGFAVLGDEINGDRALWISNPRVWVVTFRLLEASR